MSRSEIGSERREIEAGDRNDDPVVPYALKRGPSTRVLHLLLIFTLLGLVSVLPSILQLLAEQQPLPFWRLFSEFVSWMLWALFVPIALWTVERYPITRHSWKRRLPVYAVIVVVVPVLYAVVDLLKASLFQFLSAGPPMPTLRQLGVGYFFGIEFFILVWVTILSVIHSFEYYRRYQDRELTASRLEARLTRAQLQVLRNQLNPHFLFNTLNAISALMHRDVDAADSMIVRLSDFLRLSLERGDEQEIPLHQELDLLEHYIEIEKVRFGDRLVVTLDIEPELLDAMVPSMVLQPLIENAIKHGISSRSMMGEIGVRARAVFPDKVELRVVDNGPGMKGDPRSALKPGIGLHNTRERMRQLYGEQGRFEMSNAQPGGFQVSLVFPRRDFEPEAGSMFEMSDLEVATSGSFQPAEG